MNNSTIVMAFTAALIGLIVLVIFIHVLTERKKRKRISKNFMSFSENFQASQKNLRAVPRINIPEGIEVIMTLTDNDFFGLRANIIDMSLSGFSVKPDFPLKKLPLNAKVSNVLVVTPINTFAIKEMKTVRIDHHLEKRLLALQIAQIDVDQFENVKRFMGHLDEFQNKNHRDDHG